MVEVLRGTNDGPLGALSTKVTKVDVRIFRQALGFVGPVLVLAVLVISIMLTWERGSFLRDWDDTYGAEGTYVVFGCAAVDNFTADHLACDGQFGSGSSSRGTSTLVTSFGAAASERPFVGEQLDVFHAVGDTATVYPVEYKLNELARLYLSLLPRLFFAVGSLLWLLGWVTTRKLDPADLVARDSMRFPQRFNWRSRGVSWIFAGLGFLAINHFLTVRLLGSLGIL